MKRFSRCFNKPFVTTPDYHARYLGETLNLLEAATWLPTHERTLNARRANQALGFASTMFGYEIIPFL